MTTEQLRELAVRLAHDDDLWLLFQAHVAECMLVVMPLTLPTQIESFPTILSRTDLMDAQGFTREDETPPARPRGKK